MGMELLPRDIARAFPVPHGTGQMVRLWEGFTEECERVVLRKS